MVTQNVGTMVAGEMVGEVSLLHNIPRTATITTISKFNKLYNTKKVSLFAAPCEFLCLKKEDFELVLKETVMGAWDKILAAMKRFRYFDKWDEVAQREFCIRSKLKKFKINQTILGDGTGYKNYTYFVLKGQCVVIEHLFMKVSMKGGRKVYQLLEDGPETQGNKEHSVVTEKPSKVSKTDKPIAHSKDDGSLMTREKS